VLPADLAFGAPSLSFKDIAEVEATRLEEISTLKEEQMNIVIQSARYQQTLWHYHDRVVRFQAFSIKDLALQRILSAEGRHKLSPTWEGPYIIT
jgi:hypothetical protein